MKGELALHIVHIAGTCMIKSGIDGLSRNNHLTGMARGLITFQVVPLEIGSVERSKGVATWMRS